MNPVNLINFMDNDDFLAYQALDHIISSNRGEPQRGGGSTIGQRTSIASTSKATSSYREITFWKTQLIRMNIFVDNSECTEAFSSEFSTMLLHTITILTRSKTPPGSLGYPHIRRYVAL
ncbi:hypothetical protein PSTT_11937 [Puccinia striiformis]|uniref:Uncharacterized protein n=1 Tax=Puccinia striiformis TaxID=27350 RepID=A0A2S4UY36_9BASI|nr:hypothetical protein PSTT_11937 [Puccinia striiformis]